MRKCTKYFNDFGLKCPCGGKKEIISMIFQQISLNLVFLYDISLGREKKDKHEAEKNGFE